MLFSIDRSDMESITTGMDKIPSTTQGSYEEGMKVNVFGRFCVQTGVPSSGTNNEDETHLEEFENEESSEQQMDQG